MSRIHLLTEQVCNKIAAGEVVERPASVVKELIENALDAEATRISVMVEQAGRKLISVRDNGCGMDEEDALLCLESHATSKIKNEEDIFAISSFGFRGEAIPSIASVSRFTIRTRTKEKPAGTEVVIHAGKFISNVPAGCAPGTEVIVRDLFYNLPARKKFIRSDATEERHILECVMNLALANPAVAFELKLDGRTVISSPSAETLTPRVRDLFGKSYADALFPVRHSDFGISVSGFISRRSFTRNSRGDQRIFVNGRCIEAQAVYRGIREGYGPMDAGRYPAALLFLTLDPKDVDVNVHPAKREVRFRKEYEIVAAVRSAVTKALRQNDPVIPLPEDCGDGGTLPSSSASLYPDFRPSDPVPAAPPADHSNLQDILRTAQVNYTPVPSLFRKPPLPPPSAPSSDGISSGPFASEAPPSPAPEKNEEVENPVGSAPEFIMETEPSPSVSASNAARPPEFKLLGTLENSYLVGTIPGGLVLIDQHAAHERVLFEKILKGQDGTVCQKLLLPITLEITRPDMAFVMKNLDAFARIGFEIEPFGSNTLKLNGIPAAVPQENAGGLFQDILSRLSEDGAARKKPLESIAQAACKAAVKAHDVLTREECEALLKQLSECELPFSCPHGRPTVLNLSISEIERRFGRK